MIRGICVMTWAFVSLSFLATSAFYVFLALLCLGIDRCFAWWSFYDCLRKNIYIQILVCLSLCWQLYNQIFFCFLPSLINTCLDINLRGDSLISPEKNSTWISKSFFFKWIFKCCLLYLFIYMNLYIGFLLFLTFFISRSGGEDDRWLLKNVPF